MPDINTNRTESPDPVIAGFQEINRRLFNPVHHAIFLHKFDEARAALDAARSGVETGDYSADITEALHWNLLFNTYFLDWHPAVNGWTKSGYIAAREQFSKSGKTTLGEFIRRRNLLTIKFHAELDGFDKLTRPEIAGLLVDMPLELSGPPWYDVSLWAYLRGDVELLEQAFEAFLVRPPELMGQAQWQRVNLMYQLLTGKATTRDVEETIRTLEVRPQCAEFIKYFWPDCIAAGLVDEQLTALLQERVKHAEAAEQMPEPERRTKSFMKDPSQIN